MITRIFFIIIMAASVQSAPNTCDGKANAKNCQDSTSSTVCQQIFTNIDDCYNDDFVDVAALCRNTCSTCCEEPAYDCDDTNAFCDAATCNQLADVMFDTCKSTCGWCDQKTVPCTDAITRCAPLKENGLCDTDAQTKLNCRKTCGICKATPPVDVDTTMKTTIKTTTTKRTTTTRKPTTSQCYDAHINCVYWVANGFCSNPDANLKRTYCARSCGYC